MFQQTICADRLIDFYYKKDYDSRKMLSSVSDIFPGIKHEYIEDRLNNKIPRYKNTLNKLLEIKGVEQKTSEWYQARKTLITASDYAQALGEGKFGTQKQFYQKKCGYVDETFDPYIPPLKWGCMFEDVASEIYAKRNNVLMNAFGLLRHPNIAHIGASPDGISELGIMLEIKCPFKRKINGEVPAQYYYQVQCQLDVCGLDECDYLECDFKVVDNECEFWEAFENCSVEMGIIVEIGNQTCPIYRYSPIISDKNELMNWESENYHKSENDKIYRWRLNQYNVVRIYKDEEFISTNNNKIKGVWDNIIRYRNDKSCYDRELYTKPKKQTENTNTEFSFRII